MTYQRIKYQRRSVESNGIEIRGERPGRDVCGGEIARPNRRRETAAPRSGTKGAHNCNSGWMRGANLDPWQHPSGAFATREGDTMWKKIDAASAKTTIVDARRAGLTLAKACAAAGVHVATACRWRVNDVVFARDFDAATESARRQRFAGLVAALRPVLKRPEERPRVVVHRDCPRCAAPVEVRKARGRFRGAPFWRCSRWPQCGWSGWRPRHTQDCSACSGPRFWSQSRASVSCPRCGTREMLGTGSMRNVRVISL